MCMTSKFTTTKCIHAGSGGTYLPINSEPCIPCHLHNGSGFNIWTLVKEAFDSDCNTSEQSKVCIANQRLTLDLFRGYEVYILNLEAY